MRAAGLLILLLLGLLAPTAQAQGSDGALCRSAISAAETSLHIPDAFLSAIARVESGRPDRETGGLIPWPWTINAEGQGSFFTSKAQAIEAVRALQARGVRSIDIGCLQINLMHHPDAFASLDQAFDPASNAMAAGRLLLDLFAQTRAWPRAAAAYHSQTPTVGGPYQQRVLAEWSRPEGDAGAKPPRLAVAPHKDSVAVASTPATILPTLGAPAREPGAAFGRISASSIRGAPAGSGQTPTGRGLAAYRAMPTLLATRWTPRRG